MDPAGALIHLELKYCERCGGLWLRPRSAASVYCSRCARPMAELARHHLPPSPSDSGSSVAITATSLLLACQPWLEILGGCA